MTHVIPEEQVKPLYETPDWMFYDYTSFAYLEQKYPKEDFGITRAQCPTEYLKDSIFRRGGEFDVITFKDKKTFRVASKDNLEIK